MFHQRPCGLERLRVAHPFLVEAIQFAGEDHRRGRFASACFASFQEYPSETLRKAGAAD